MAETDPAYRALRDLRRKRQLHRLGNIEWFDAAYRVYLLGFFGGGTILWISSSVKDGTVAASTSASFASHAPAVLGLIAAMALLAGLRGGSQGGPIALEAADVVHVMLAPVDRRRALLRPAVQRARGAVFAGATAGAIVGQLAGRRLPGSLLAWAAGGALYGGTVAAMWAGAALLAHTMRLPRWAATSAGLAVFCWQAAAITWHVPGPATTTGSLGLWGWRQHPIDLLPVAVGLIAVIVGLTQLSRISLEALARRSALVAQLRFAVTMQDLRTVILLRRQLNQESTRRHPWHRLGPTRTRTFTRSVWRRGWHGLLRFPATRIVRLAALAAGIGVLQAAAVRGTTPAVLGSALLAFVLGLEVFEPLSQEVDQPDYTDGLPVARGELMVRHLAAPSVALIPFAVIAAAAAVLAMGTTEAIIPAAILALPTLLGGAAGGVISIVRDAPDPFSSSNQQAFIPPEMAGFTTTLRLLWPIVISALGTCTVLIVRLAVRHGDSTIGAAVRGTVGSLLVAGLVAYWTKVRDPIRIRIRAFMDEGRAQTSAQRSRSSS
ncbi:MAG: hypothetical protein F2681_03270 [Actinobacteria bacterium]|uniref:Unannotated protein n=2 Tax=freshwater metagenome TaxID=449393 RepID=A0A6J7HQ23_9ZZZZ|nr:hypothetical protein [Actinomycetota bacterium]MSW76694.1 hypothetical protein [Actinomycetota bacterium]MSX92207.1 hypothetical protein [Actinomycetota bacterium]MSZ82141.1 hypothetical protein [Actinomycetota bacterium]MTB16980.1 hypothetical protein [Actinomycetota bacterium]